MKLTGTPFNKIKKIIVNEHKTKSIYFGTDENLNVFFNGKPIEQVNQLNTSASSFDLSIRPVKVYIIIITDLFLISATELYLALYIW